MFVRAHVWGTEIRRGARIKGGLWSRHLRHHHYHYHYHHHHHYHPLFVLLASHHVTSATSGPASAARPRSHHSTVTPRRTSGACCVVGPSPTPTPNPHPLHPPVFLIWTAVSSCQTSTSTAHTHTLSHRVPDMTAFIPPPPSLPPASWSFGICGCLSKPDARKLSDCCVEF